MPRPNVAKLPESDRRQSITEFLGVFDQHPNLAAFRAAVRTGSERQLALFAALERAVVVGNAALSPPHPDDLADQILCDLLDVIDTHPDLKRQGAYYGPDRHLANLQAFGLWRKKAPLSRPTARELFATAFSALTATTTTSLTLSELNNSPAPQDVRPNGELIEVCATETTSPDSASDSPQPVDRLVVVTVSAKQPSPCDAADSGGIIRHADAPPGEESSQELIDSAPEPQSIPARAVRRGRPVALDDLAKGRLLGLMSHGLSFRQAAAQLGVHHQTLLNTMKRDEEFAQQVAEARLDAISQPLLTVMKASRTSWRAAAWLAKYLSDQRTRIYETTPEERELEKIKRR